MENVSNSRRIQSQSRPESTVRNPIYKKSKTDIYLLLLLMLTTVMMILWIYSKAKINFYFSIRIDGINIHFKFYWNQEIQFTSESMFIRVAVFLACPQLLFSLSSSLYFFLYSVDFMLIKVCCVARWLLFCCCVWLSRTKLYLPLYFIRMDDLRKLCV